MKKVYAVLLLLVLGIAACGSDDKLQTEGAITFDINNLSKENQEKYDSLKELFKEYKSDYAFGTTSTANLFDDLGLDVSAAPTSPSLNKDLTDNQVDIKDYKEGTDEVINLGSALKINNEVIIEMKPKVFFYADGMMATNTTYKILEDNGIKTYAMPQSNFEDIFIIMQALKDSGVNNEKFDTEFKKLNTNLEEIKKLKEGKTSQKVAIIQNSGSTNLTAGNDTLAGKVANELGIDNIYGNDKSTEVNKEVLIEQNPDVIIYYTHSYNDHNDKFSEFINQKEFANLKAVKDKKIVKLGNKEYSYSPSVDLSITELMKQLVEVSYVQK